MYKLGLVGRGISHSKSQQMYEDLLKTSVDYHLLDYESEEQVPAAKDFFEQGFKGISITYPYKKTFINQVKVINEKIESLKAINCIRCDGKILVATNTDYLAANELLKRHLNKGKKFIVLGSGNMATIFLSLLADSNETYIQVSRSQDGDLNKYDYSALLDQKTSELFLINCCSREFVFKSSLPENSSFWDMNYSMKEHDSLFDRGITYCDGLELLRMQAKFALKFWKIENL